MTKNQKNYYLPFDAIYGCTNRFAIDSDVYSPLFMTAAVYAYLVTSNELDYRSH